MYNCVLFEEWITRVENFVFYKKFSELSKEKGEINMLETKDEELFIVLQIKGWKSLSVKADFFIK